MDDKRVQEIAELAASLVADDRGYVSRRWHQKAVDRMTPIIGAAIRRALREEKAHSLKKLHDKLFAMKTKQENKIWIDES